MPTKYVAIGVVALIIIAGAFAYFSYSKPADSGQAATGQENNTADASGTETASAGAFTGSMGDLLGRGGDWKCTFDVTNSGAHSMGTVYVSEKRLRGDFSSTLPQVKQVVDSHMIQDNGFVYVWTSLSSQGFKTKTSLGTEDATTKFNGQGVDINQKYGYNCTPWTVDAAMFTLPASVTFVGN